MSDKPRFYVQRDEDHWLVIDRNIRDDCPILSDWGTQAEAEAEIQRIQKEYEDLWHNLKWALDLLPNVPMDQRGFGV